MSKENKVIIGFAAAALAGIGIGLLLAPHSGTKSRKKIRQGTNDMANKLMDVVTSKGDTLKEKASEVVENAKSAFNQAKGYAKSEVNHAKKEIDEAV